MKRNDRVFLSDREFATISAIFACARADIGPVRVFGSRATGRARAASDLDLVVFPPSPASELRDLRFAFEESDLPIEVDVIAWDEITSQDLRDEISRHSIPLFEDAPA